MRHTTVISDARKNPHFSMSMNYRISCDHIHVVLKGFKIMRIAWMATLHEIV